MKKRKIIVLSFLATIISTTLVLNSALEAKETPSRQDEFRKFTKVISTIENYYVDDLTINEIMDKALDGLLTKLDAHSGYLEPKAYTEMNIKTKGEFGGLGITVGVRNGALTVIAPIEGTPADKAGLKAEDIILKIDEQSSLGMGIDEAVSLMRGKPGSDIQLTIVRKGIDKPLDVEITRDIIKIQSVYHKKFKEDVLYLRITSFDKNVAPDLSEAIKDSRDWSKGIILDLRNNPGGLLNQAVDTVDLFVDDGVIVSQKGKIQSENREYTASSSSTLTDLPMVVLVNAGSASASEIVSGALQDHKRGVVLGDKTFGKGSVQVILPLNDKDAIRLTVARYYLPSGRTIQATGVTPDIEVKQAKVEELTDNFAIKESELKDHLTAKLEEIDGKDVNTTKVEEKAEDNKHVLTDETVKNDYQLRTGINVLRALIITEK